MASKAVIYCIACTYDRPDPAVLPNSRHTTSTLCHESSQKVDLFLQTRTYAYNTLVLRSPNTSLYRIVLNSYPPGSSVSSVAKTVPKANIRELPLREIRNFFQNRLLAIQGKEALMIAKRSHMRGEIRSLHMRGDKSYSWKLCFSQQSDRVRTPKSRPRRRGPKN